MMGGARDIRNQTAQHVLDAIAGLMPRRRPNTAPATIGVFLFWGIGDAVLTTPFLHALRAAYPAAHIVAIGKPWTADLFGDEAVFDQFHTLVPPWTAHRGKYRIWSAEWPRFAREVAALRGMKFDLLVSLRPDPRETVLARVLKTAAFAGYAASGAAAWVTSDLGEAVPNEAALYRGTLAACAAETLFRRRPDGAPRLTAQPSANVLRQLREAGYATGPILALAFGAAHPLRRWSGERIGATLQQLRRQPAGYLVIDGGDTPAIDVPKGVPVVRWRGSLAEAKQALAAADVLFCSDSGLLHVGTAVGCRTVSVFGPGSLSRFAPPGPYHAAYAVEPMPCRPCFDNCRYPSPLCMDQIDTAQVAALVDAALDAARRDTAPRAVGGARV
jgi:ADP-heptose:LPS heptosyltransferase